MSNEQKLTSNKQRAKSFTSTLTKNEIKDIMKVINFLENREILLKKTIFKFS